MLALRPPPTLYVLPAMDLYDWLLFLHVLGAFVAVGALTALWALILGTRGATPLFDPPLGHRPTAAPPASSSASG